MINYGLSTENNVRDSLRQGLNEQREKEREGEKEREMIPKFTTTVMQVIFSKL